jgi:hypothetical protein
MSDREQRYYDALKRIASYMPPDKLRKIAARKYGLSEQEAIEFAYENVLADAAAAIKGMRRPRDREAPDSRTQTGASVAPDTEMPK